jgi:hypothetical protein
VSSGPRLLGIAVPVARLEATAGQHRREPPPAVIHAADPALALALLPAGLAAVNLAILHCPEPTPSDGLVSISRRRGSVRAMRPTIAAVSSVE